MSLKHQICICAILAHMLMVSTAAVINSEAPNGEQSLFDYSQSESDNNQMADEIIAKLLTEERYRYIIASSIYYFAIF